MYVIVLRWEALDKLEDEVTICESSLADVGQLILVALQFCAVLLDGLVLLELLSPEFLE